MMNARPSLVLLLAALPGTYQDSKPTAATVWSFEDQKEGESPTGWQVAETRGKGTKASWRVEADAHAASGKRVVRLAETRNQGETYNLLLSEATHPADLRLRVALRADSGNEDQGGGLLWRARDQDNYYITRWNPLEGNLRLYQVEDGRRTQFATVDLRADAKAWHELEARMTGQEIEVWFDGRRELSWKDDTFTAGGKVGLWTKADAAVSFDDLRLLPPARLPTGLEHDVADGADFADTPGYREMVRQVAEGRAPKAGPSDPILEAQPLLADPERYRGKAVRVRGILVQCVAQKLEHPAGAVREVYRGFLSDTDGGNFIAFDLPKAPPRFRARRDVAEIDGVFYRAVRYETRRGTLVEVPYVIARSLTVLDGAGK